MTAPKQLRLDITIRPEPINHPTQPGVLPDWIATQLHDNRASLDRAARFHYCRTCNAIVMTGLDADLIAFQATVDPTPLTRPSQIACLIQARKLYNAWSSPTTGWDLTPCHSLTYAHRLVLPAHHCGYRFPGFIAPPARQPGQDPGPPPY